MSNNYVILFIKEPLPGGVNEPLIGYLSPEKAAQLYQAFISDSIERIESLASIGKIKTKIICIIDKNSDKIIYGHEE